MKESAKASTAKKKAASASDEATVKNSCARKKSVASATTESTRKAVAAKEKPAARTKASATATVKTASKTTAAKSSARTTTEAGTKKVATKPATKSNASKVAAASKASRVKTGAPEDAEANIADSENTTTSRKPKTAAATKATKDTKAAKATKSAAATKVESAKAPSKAPKAKTKSAAAKAQVKAETQVHTKLMDAELVAAQATDHAAAQADDDFFDNHGPVIPLAEPKELSQTPSVVLAEDGVAADVVAVDSDEDDAAEQSDKHQGKDRTSNYDKIRSLLRKKRGSVDAVTVDEDSEPPVLLKELPRRNQHKSVPLEEEEREIVISQKNTDASADHAIDDDERGTGNYTISKYYYPDGKLRAQIPLKNNVIHGECVFYEENVALANTFTMKNGKLESPMIRTSSAGRLELYPLTFLAEHLHDPKYEDVVTNAKNLVAESKSFMKTYKLTADVEHLNMDDLEEMAQNLAKKENKKGNNSKIMLDENDNDGPMLNEIWRNILKSTPNEVEGINVVFKSLRNCYVRAYDNHGNLSHETQIIDGNNMGLLIAYHPTGERASMSFSLSGKFYGPYFGYDTDGALRQRLNFFNHLLEGEQEFYYSNGQLQRRCFYRNGMLTGKFNMYFPNGTPCESSEMINGVREGLSTTYDEKGMPQVIANMKEGLRHGLCEFYEAGKRMRTCQYKEGNRSGEEKWFYYSGNPAIVRHYDKDVLHGATLIYDDVPSSEPLVVMEYQHGRLINKTKIDYSTFNNELIAKLTNANILNKNLAEPLVSMPDWYSSKLQGKQKTAIFKQLHVFELLRSIDANLMSYTDAIIKEAKEED